MTRTGKFVVITVALLFTGLNGWLLWTVGRSSKDTTAGMPQAAQAPAPAEGRAAPPAVPEPAKTVPSNDSRGPDELKTLPVAKITAAAVRTVTAAADKGDMGACLKLGRFYADRGGPANERIAAKWLRKAAIRGDGRRV